MVENNNTPRTEISELGEFGLIERIRSATHCNLPNTFLGIGDDAAIIDNGNQFLLFSTDMLVEGIHFDLSFTPLMHLGYKAVSINVSDIAAMNGKASHITVSLAISNRFSVEAIDELYKGILLACKTFQVDLVGGDTTSSLSGLIISVSVIGSVEKEKVVQRKGAKVNDLLCVTGDLGGSYMGLLVLQREKSVFLGDPSMQPELKGFDYILKKHLRPEARIDVIEEFKKLEIVPTSMIDISDGLSSELLHIAKNSGGGIEIFEDKLPIDPLTKDTATSFNINPTTGILNGGEDYELLFTIDIKEYDKIKSHPDFTAIGYITEKEKGNKLVTKSGSKIELIAQGWKHF